MREMIRINLGLAAATLLLCAVLYPLALWGIGQALFPAAANGSLLVDADGTVRGARRIAQPFTDPRYFWPRPSAVGYNAAASGASNWAANNPLLRDRVARQLGPLVRYRHGDGLGRRVGPEIEAWYRTDRGEPPLLARWAAVNPTLAARWVKDDANQKAVRRWLQDHPALVAGWRRDHPDAPALDLDALAVPVLQRFAAAHPHAWPVPQERPGGESHLAPVEPDPSGRTEIPDLQGVLFDTWLQAHPEAAARLAPVPADMVTASGSGLDPHLTLDSALYQLDDRVADAWARKLGRERGWVRDRIAALLLDQVVRPLGGLAGGPLVNVLEVNHRLEKWLTEPVR